MKMNLIIARIIPAVFATGLLFVSCKKDFDSKSNVESKSKLEHATSMAGLQNLATVDEVEQFITAVYSNSAEAKEILDGSCPPVIKVILDNPPNRFPRKEIIDWGTGCTLANGTTLSGRIIRRYLDTMSNIGARLITKYDNFFKNGVQIEGKSTITHINIPDPNTYKLVQINRKLTQPNGDFIIYNSERNLIKLIPDDVTFPPNTTGWYKIKGTQVGDEMKGGASYQWTSTVDPDNPLIYKFCEFITKGVANIVFTGDVNQTWQVDYGKIFQCDDQAELSVDGAPPVTVTLPLDY